MADNVLEGDWRGYAKANGIPPMQAWIACQRAFRASIPSGTTVTSPKSLDLLATDPDLWPVIRATIDDVRNA